MANAEMAVAVVTGAASGIGRALCTQLAAKGFQVVAADRDADGLAAVAAETIHPRVVDVTENDQVEALIVGARDQFGRLDQVFNNAGVVVGGSTEAMTHAQWQHIIDVNLWGVVHGTRHAYAVMLTQGFGHIVNTSSSAGMLPVPRSTAYAATKHAVIGLSASLRAEAAPRGIKVSAAVPGIVDTAIFGSAINLPGFNYRAAIDRVPMRPLTPERAAGHILEGVRKNKAHIIFPKSNAAVILAYKLFPEITGRMIARQT
ncbi:SDR family NAD(P)-dependent oxidoreductase [Nocardia sp. NPDC056952]|uniref:SDR family NAD(P)-dependent oxidoreductase n=1 Tax=Nocardia sp. NPDC056952 TaxID=3345979 RepID=UPI00363CC21F